MLKDQKNNKTLGQIYTPKNIVKLMCDFAHYTFGNINKKHVIDNSCGDGAFLVEFVSRYCQDFLKKSKNLTLLKKELETYIHGIELDPIAAQNAKLNCQSIVKSFGLNNVNFDIVLADTTKIYQKYKNKMDFVIGNPPYVRVHNFGDNYVNFKKFNFVKKGMADLYLIFYDIGIQMLTPTGHLTYITPNSFTTSVVGQSFRNWLYKTHSLTSVINFKHQQLFENATTYSIILNICNNKKFENVEYYEYLNNSPISLGTINYNDIFINNLLFFSTKNNLCFLKNILKYKQTTLDTFKVKNGFATLNDDLYISNFNFNSKYLIKILKASTGEWKQCIYPYDTTNKLIKWSILSKDKNIKKILINKNVDKTNPTWYGFGRTQAIQDTNSNKIGINSIIKSKKDLKIELVPSGCGLYSGLYILSPHDISTSQITKSLKSNTFIKYISLLGKYKNGGFYTFSSKDLQQYLNWKFKK